MDTLTFWHDANKLIQQIAEHKNSDKFYITIVPSHLLYTGTFAKDNWEYLLQYWNEFIDLTKNIDHEISVVLVIREFTNMKVIGRDLPLKKVAAAVLTPSEIMPLTGKEFKEASSFDNKTGAPLKPEPDVNYLDFTELARQLKLNI